MGLKGIPAVLSPEMLQVLAAMGHADEIVLTDIHFPSSSCSRNGAVLLRADGHSTVTVLRAILKLFPLDEYVDSPVVVMDPEPQDKAAGLTAPPVWDEFKKCLAQSGEKNIKMTAIERFQFYERTKNAFAIVHTGETAKYGNIILKKGIVTEYD